MSRNRFDKARDRLTRLDPIGVAQDGNIRVLGPSAPPPGSTRLLPTDSAGRKRFPLTTGVLDYFPDALAAVAEVSYIGNKKHNPGQDLHWSRGVSDDHADCITRHLEERGTWDLTGSEKVRHSAQLAWRALALLQEELEEELILPISRGSRARSAS